MRRLATDESVGYTAARTSHRARANRKPAALTARHVPSTRGGLFLFDGPLDPEMRIDLISVQKSYRPQIRPVKSEFSNTFVAAY
jgi:hypothetical protein